MSSISNVDSLIVRFLQEDDIDLVVKECMKNDWPKSKSLFEMYLYEQYLNQLLVWLAFWDNNLAGYCTLKIKSEYNPFRISGIAEIKDLNVFPHYRNQGIGSKLLTIAENEALKKNKLVGIGVGLSEDYGNAQKIYVQRGYVPDGNGITYNYMKVEYGKQIILDDDLVLWFIKQNKNI